MRTLILVSLSLLVACLLGEPNPPYFPNSVYVFSPSSPGYTQSIIDRVFSTNGGDNPPFNGQFVNNHYAFLFLPGTHNVNVNLGFYTSVVGTGIHPADTYIGTVRVADGDPNYQGGALDNFWRSAENFATAYTLWAVSQACPVRRALIKGNLDLYQYTGGCCAGFASGGFMADSTVTGNINSGSQQQYFTRNTNMGQWDGGVWNMVFVGNSGGVPQSHCGNQNGNPFTTVSQTPVIAEKPYIATRNGGDSWVLRVPKVEYNKVGPTTNYDNVDEIDFSNVYVSNSSDSAAKINMKLSQGLHILLTPGTYNLEQPITVTNPNTVILGIGFPILVPTSGQPVISVGNVDGVRVAGVLIQASNAPTSVLLKWGDEGYSGDPNNPSFLYDIFVRVGGPNDPNNYQVNAQICIQLNSGNVVLDNSWIWRADHDIAGIVRNSQNPSFNGIEINGDYTTVYGLAIEHHLHDQLVWNGNHGRLYFYQSELPYDVTQGNFGDPGYCGYKVADSVSNHNAWGVGIYSYFRDNSVTVNSGIKAPGGSGISFVAPFTRFLSGNGQITHVLNNQGSAVNAGSQLSYIC